MRESFSIDLSDEKYPFAKAVADRGNGILDQVDKPENMIEQMTPYQNQLNQLHMDVQGYMNRPFNEGQTWNDRVYNQDLIEQFRKYPLTPEQVFPSTGSDWDIDKWKEYIQNTGISIYNQNDRFSVRHGFAPEMIGTYKRKMLLLL